MCKHAAAVKERETMDLKESRGEGTLWETLEEGQRRGKMVSLYYNLKN